MANFKRKGPKATRSGCLMCKPYKLNFNKTAKRMKDRQKWRKHEERANG